MGREGWPAVEFFAAPRNAPHTLDTRFPKAGVVSSVLA